MLSKLTYKTTFVRKQDNTWKIWLDASREMFTKGKKYLFAFIGLVKLKRNRKLLKKIQNIMDRNTPVELERSLSSGNFSF